MRFCVGSGICTCCGDIRRLFSCGEFGGTAAGASVAPVEVEGGVAALAKRRTSVFLCAAPALHCCEVGARSCMYRV